VGNYGVPANGQRDGVSNLFESDRVHIAGLVVSELSREFSHWSAVQSLADWLKEHRVPGLAGGDTRMVTQRLRESGAMLGKLRCGDEEVDFRDPSADNLVAQVSVSNPKRYGGGKEGMVLIDWGWRNGIRASVRS